MQFFRKHWWKFSALYLFLIVGLLFLIRGSLRHQQPRQIYFSDFMSEIRKGSVTDVRISETELTGTLTSKGSARIRAPRLPGMDIGNVINELEANHIRFTGKDEEEAGTLVSWILPAFVLCVFLFFIAWRFRQGASMPFGFSKSQAKQHDHESQSRTTFEDVAGIDESKAELTEVVDFLRQPEKYQRLGGRVPKGVLLVGPPGTGKTLLERASALARQLVTRYGMSEQLGLMTYGRPPSGRYLQPAGSEDRNYSERTAELIDQESRKIIDRLYDRVKNILSRRCQELDLIARELIRKETLTSEELGAILDGSEEAVNL